MLIPIALALIYGLFLLWHEPWLVRRLRPGEAVEVLGGAYDDLSAAERERFAAFMDADDGRPFCMVNLLEYREWADYRPGSALNGSTPTGIIGGRDAGWLYTRAVLPELLKRGCYPVFVAGKLANLLSAGAGSDFFEDVVIVRYRSRRDMLAMIASPAFRHAVPHKWASLEKTVAVPCRRLLLIDPGVLVPLVLLAFWLLFRHG
jgi:hypothetical protein